MTDTIATETEHTSLVITSMQPGLAVEGNFEAVKAHIASLVADYQGLVVTEGYLAQAKKDRAYLNSLATALTQRYREVKRAYMAPVDALDRQIKELEAPIKEASAAIDAQVKAFEERERAEKRAALVAHYAEYAPILVESVPFERVEDPAWLLKSCSLTKALEAVEAVVDRIARDDAMLDSLNLPYADDAKTEYFATLDVSRAIARSKHLEEAAERTRRFEEEKAAIAAQWEADAAKAKEAAPEPAPAPEAAPQQTAGDPCATCDEDPGAACSECVFCPEDVARERTFTVRATDAQVDGIIAYLKAAGIQGSVTR